VQALARQELQRPLGVQVEGSEEAAAEVAEVAAAVAHLAVPQGVLLVVLGPEALRLLVVAPEVYLVIPASLVVVTDPLERTDYLPSLMVPVRVLVPAFQGVPASVGSLDPSPVGTAGGVAATMAQPPVETVPLTRWFPLW
jgi:hypothetical protein